MTSLTSSDTMSVLMWLFPPGVGKNTGFVPVYRGVPLGVFSNYEDALAFKFMHSPKANMFYFSYGRNDCSDALFIEQMRYLRSAIGSPNSTMLEREGWVDVLFTYIMCHEDFLRKHSRFFEVVKKKAHELRSEVGTSYTSGVLTDKFPKFIKSMPTHSYNLRPRKH